MIWAIVILTSLWSFAATALAGNHTQVMDATRKALKANGFSAASSSTGCFMAIVAWAIAACWVVYAFQVHDWRFAAIALIPKAAGMLLHLARPRQRAEIVR